MRFTFLRGAVIAAITLFSSCQLAAQTKREIQLYTVVAKADKRYKGILEKVTEDQIFLSVKGGKYINIPRNNLKVLKVKEFPKKKRAIKLLQPQPGLSAYDQNGFLRKEYLDSEPSLGEKVVISGATVVLKSVYGFVYNGLNNLMVFRVKGDSVKYRNWMKEMGEYAVYNQAVAEDDIRQLKGSQ